MSIALSHSGRSQSANIPAPWALWLMPFAGLLLSLAFPNDILPGAMGDHPSELPAWIALVPLLWAVRALSPGRARRAAWLFGLAFYAGTLSWVRLFGYLPWALLTAYLALTPVLAVVVTQRMRLRGPAAPLAFALAWTSLEWLRGQGPYGLAWSEVGASQVENPLSAIAAVGGVPLITFLMLWVVGAVAQRIADRSVPRWAVVAPLAVLLACLLSGRQQTRAAMARWGGNSRAQVISVVQPSALRGLTPGALLHDVSFEESQRRLRDLLALSANAAEAARAVPGAGEAALLVIWPESALPGLPEDGDIHQFCARTGARVLVGAPSYADITIPGTLAARRRVRNSAYLVEAGRSIPRRYDKIRLVPFGEFVPLRPLVSAFYTVRRYDILPGRLRQPLAAGEHALGIGICFESTFPSIARAYARQGAGLLVFITNDAWFHRTAAVRQHSNHARFRAIESGLPVARAASTGISGFIVPDGRVLGEIPVYQRATLTLRIPDGRPGTLYTRMGWLFGIAASLITFWLLAAGARAMPLRRKAAPVASG